MMEGVAASITGRVARVPGLDSGATFLVSKTTAKRQPSTANDTQNAIIESSVNGKNAENRN